MDRGRLFIWTVMRKHDVFHDATNRKFGENNSKIEKYRVTWLHRRASTPDADHSYCPAAPCPFPFAPTE